MKPQCIPKTALLFGLLLNLVGFIGFFSTGSTHYTALIPSFLGVLLIISGWIGLQEKLRRHAMHFAVLVVLIGFLGTAGALSKLPALLNGSDGIKMASDIAKIATCLLSGGFFLICLQWFLKSRQEKKKGKED